jgi:hypothetical protein
MNRTMGKDELDVLRRQARDDRKLLRRAERALAEIDRGPGLSDEHADVLAALRIRLEGRERASLEDLMSDWPVIEEKPRDWPGL